MRLQDGEMGKWGSFDMCDWVIGTLEFWNLGTLEH